MFLMPIGLSRCTAGPKTDAKIFQFLYLVISGYFSTKMVRLILILAPAAAVSAAMALEALLGWCLEILLRDLEGHPPAAAAAKVAPAAVTAPAEAPPAADGGGKADGKAKKGKEPDANDAVATAKADADATALARQKKLEAMTPLEVRRAVLIRPFVG